MPTSEYPALDEMNEQCVPGPNGNVHMKLDPETGKVEELGPCEDPKHQVIQAAQSALKTATPQPKPSTVFPID